jgi:hypothetical protein
MLLTPFEYSVMFLCNGKIVSPKTIKRRCENGMLPSGHNAVKLSGGWVIEIKDEPAASGWFPASGMVLMNAYHNSFR